MGHRSDIYTIGVILFELLTGERLIRAGGIVEIIAEILHTPAPRFKERNPATSKVPSKVEKLVLSCLEKDPERRPQSARELAERFRRLALPPCETRPPSTTTPRPRRLFLGSAVVAGVALVATLTGMEVVRRGRTNVPAPAQQREAVPRIRLPAAWKAADEAEWETSGKYSYPRVIEHPLPGEPALVCQLVGEGPTTSPFYTTVNPVTVGQYSAFAREKPDLAGTKWTKDGPRDRPVRNIKGFEAEAFAGWVGAKLPTFEQWDYAKENIYNKMEKDDPFEWSRRSELESDPSTIRDQPGLRRWEADPVRVSRTAMRGACFSHRRRRSTRRNEPAARGHTRASGLRGSGRAANKSSKNRNPKRTSALLISGPGCPISVASYPFSKWRRNQ